MFCRLEWHMNGNIYHRGILKGTFTASFLNMWAPSTTVVVYSICFSDTKKRQPRSLNVLLLDWDQIYLNTSRGVWHTLCSDFKGV